MKGNKSQTGRSAYTKGLWAEALCRLVLRLKLYHILTSRYKTPMGEIDLIAARGHTLVFIEVKARPTQGEAIASVSSKQRQRLIRAAHHFLAHHPIYQKHHARFDVMAVAPHKWPLHVINAFDGE